MPNTLGVSADIVNNVIRLSGKDPSFVKFTIKTKIRSTLNIDEAICAHDVKREGITEEAQQKDHYGTVKHKRGLIEGAMSFAPLGQHGTRAWTTLSRKP